MAHVLLIQYQFRYQCKIFCQNSIYCNAEYLKNILQYFVNKSKMTNPCWRFPWATIIFVTSEPFCLTWLKGYKICASLVAYPLLLTRSNIQIIFQCILSTQTYIHTYAPFVTLIRHFEWFCNLTFILQVATFVTIVMRLIVMECCFSVNISVTRKVSDAFCCMKLIIN